VPGYLTLWMELGPVEMFASGFHQCRKTGLTAHKFSAWPGVGVGGDVRVWGKGQKTEGGGC
jgi:hypothetical protein